MLRAFILAQNDLGPTGAEAVFVHASCVNSETLDKQVLYWGAQLVTCGRVGNIVINGLTANVCRERGLPYPGYEVWRSWLLDFPFLPEERIIKLAPAGNTPEESANLIALASERRWSNVIILSLPHHIPRCFMSALNPLKSAGYRTRVYANTPNNIRWSSQVYRTATGGAAHVNGQLADHIDAEVARIEKYSNRNDPTVTPIASPAELVNYILNIRERQRKP